MVWSYEGGLGAGRHDFTSLDVCLSCRVCSLPPEEDGGLTQEAGVVEYPGVMDEGSYVYWEPHTALIMG